MNRVYSLLAAAGLTALCAGAFAQAQDSAPPEPPPANVAVAPAVQAEFAPLHWAPGSVVSREDARIAAEIGGRVVSVAEVGTVLKKGDTLARLDDAALRLAEREAQSDIARIQAQLDYSRKQEERYEVLVRESGISGAQLDEVHSERRTLEQDLASARVALEQARLHLRQATVRAPFDGVVVERNIQIGEYLTTGAPVARLVNTSALEVRARAPVDLAARLAEGAAVTVRADERVSEQRLRTVVPVGDEASRQVELRIALDPKAFANAPLLIGSAVQVGLPSDTPRSAVAVPRDAVVLRKDGSYVMRVSADDTAERVPVDTGAAQDGLVEVRGAVRAGDVLVVRGGERLQPGQKVRRAEQGAADSAIARSEP